MSLKEVAPEGYRCGFLILYGIRQVDKTVFLRLEESLLEYFLTEKDRRKGLRSQNPIQLY